MSYSQISSSIPPPSDSKQWFDSILSDFKKRFPDLSKKDIVNMSLTHALEFSRFEYALSMGADVRSGEGKKLSSLLFGTLSNESAKKIQDKLISLLGNDFLLQFDNHAFHTSAYSFISVDLPFAKKLSSKLDINWSTLSINPYSPPPGYKGKSAPFLHCLVSNGSLSVKHFISSKSCFPDSTTQTQKQDFLLNLSHYAFYCLSIAINSKQTTKSFKKNNLSNLNFLMSQLSDEYFEKFIDACKKNGIPKEFKINKENKTWEVPSLAPQTSNTNKSYHVIQLKNNKTSKDIDFLRQNKFNFKSPDGALFLAQAIKHEKFNVSKKLVEYGVDLNNFSDAKIYPAFKRFNSFIELAATNKRPSILKFLIENDPDFASKTPATFPLFRAVESLRVKNVDVLIENGVDINQKNNIDKNALWCLLHLYTRDTDEHYKMLANLIHHGIDPFHRSSKTNETFLDSIKIKEQNSFLSCPTFAATVQEYLLKLSTKSLKANIEKEVKSPTLQKSKKNKI